MASSKKPVVKKSDALIQIPEQTSNILMYHAVNSPNIKNILVSFLEGKGVDASLYKLEGDLRLVLANRNNE